MLELVIADMQISLLAVFQIFTPMLCFFLQVSYRLLWSLASMHDCYGGVFPSKFEE